MALLSWPTPRPSITSTLPRPGRLPAARRPLPGLALRLRWALAAALILPAAPVAGALTTPAVVGPPPLAPAAVARLAGQAQGVLSVAGMELTLPLNETKVLPPVPHPSGLPFGAAFWQPVAEPPAGTIAEIIWQAAREYNVSYTWLLGVAECESGLDPVDVNRSSGASGLFQFMPATFAAHGGTDIWNPVQQAEIAAKMFSTGESGEWTCK